MTKYVGTAMFKDHQKKWTHDFVDALKNSDLPWEKMQPKPL